MAAPGEARVTASIVDLGQASGMQGLYSQRRQTRIRSAPELIESDEGSRRSEEHDTGVRDVYDVPPDAPVGIRGDGARPRGRSSIRGSLKSEQLDQVPGEEGVGLKASKDIYEAVVVAAWGGVVQVTQINGKEEMQTVHPACLFVPAACLCFCQCLLLAAVVLEVDETRFREGFDVEKVSIWDFGVKTQLGLICMVQLTMNCEIAQAANILIFCIPCRHTFQQDPNDDRSDLIKNLDFLVRTCLVIITPAAKLLVCWLTSITSISIIFTADTLTEAIFNSLALTFLKDLNKEVYQIFKTSFNLRTVKRKVVRKHSDDKLQKDTFKWAEDKKSATWLKMGEVDKDGQGLVFIYDVIGDDEWEFQVQVREEDKSSSEDSCAKRAQRKLCRLLHRGHIRSIAVAMLITWIYSDCLFLSVNVLHSAWLPAGQQACWVFRVLNGTSDSWFGQAMRPFIEFVLHEWRYTLMKKTDPDLGGFCYDGLAGERLLTLQDKTTLLALYPSAVTMGFLVVFVFVVIPPFINVYLDEKQTKAKDKKKRMTAVGGPSSGQPPAGQPRHGAAS